MKTYEMLYVLDAGLTDEANEALVKKFEDVVASSGGKVVSTDKWGVKKLAYSINYKNDGFYVLMTFEAEGSVVKELDRVAGLTSEVLRRVITAKD
ncbi:MAG: 30S ribosomal protein S6 [Clostridia bacterium]|jgi:small subunit ribosomal protein S6|nr:30S ribosomal protein S6 [Clostridia bacterium]